MKDDYVLFSKECVCRACLLRTGTTPLCNVCSIAEKSLREMLQLCTNIQVDENDNLPQCMCAICVEELINAYKFITKCIDSNAILHSTKSEWRTSISISETVQQHEESQSQSPLNDELSGCVYDGSDINYETETAEESMKAFETNQVADVDQSAYNIKSKINASKLRKSSKFINRNNKILDRTCNFCLKTFGAPFLLKQHMRSHTNERPYHCEMCPAKFTNSSNLRRHVRTHTGEKPHVCDICNKAYTQATTLIEHKRTHTGEKPYVCCYCGKSFRAYANHKTHSLKHRLEDARLNDDDKAHAHLQEFECKHCRRVLSSKGALKTHMLIHGEKTYLCSNCGKGFVTKVALRNHNRTHTGEKPFKCGTCEKAFALQASLKQHILIHTGEKPYRCKICSKGFIQYHQLKYHLRTHSGERPYVCSFCGKAFALNGNLTVHIRTHTGETPYYCPVCGKGFYDSSSMKKHKKGHDRDNETTTITLAC